MTGSKARPVSIKKCFCSNSGRQTDKFVLAPALSVACTPVLKLSIDIASNSQAKKTLAS